MKRDLQMEALVRKNAARAARKIPDKLDTRAPQTHTPTAAPTEAPAQEPA